MQTARTSFFQTPRRATQRTANVYIMPGGTSPPRSDGVVRPIIPPFRGGDPGSNPGRSIPHTIIICASRACPSSKSLNTPVRFAPPDEAEFPSLEEEGTDALEVATQAHEEGEAPTAPQVGNYLFPFFGFSPPSPIFSSRSFSASFLPGPSFLLIRISWLRSMRSCWLTNARSTHPE